MKDECGNCRFYRDDLDGTRAGFRSGYGQCLRHPEPHGTNDGKWCGDHEPTPSR